MSHIVIVGGGPAANSCALALRERGHIGGIEILTEEALAPYDRTAVSKGMLTGMAEPPRLEEAGVYAQRRIEVTTGVRASSLDTGRKILLAADGRRFAYDQLVLCTGARARIPSHFTGHDVHVLRNAFDARRLVSCWQDSTSIAIVGLGFIGGEAATAARERQLDTVVIEREQIPFSSRFGEEVGRRITDLHRSAGVDIVTGATVIDTEGLDAGGVLLTLDGGAQVHSQLLVVGAGANPAVEWLEGSGLTCGNGIVTDSRGRTNVSDVYAAGDCARWHSERYGSAVRIEHWDTAVAHGAFIAGTIMGDDVPFDPLPLFWSEQHGVKIQWVGHPGSWDRVEIEDEQSRYSFVARYFRGDRLQGVLALDRPRAISLARRELSRFR